MCRPGVSAIVRNGDEFGRGPPAPQNRADPRPPPAPCFFSARARRAQQSPCAPRPNQARARRAQTKPVRAARKIKPVRAARKIKPVRAARKPSPCAPRPNPPAPQGAPRADPACHLGDGGPCGRPGGPDRRPGRPDRRPGRPDRRPDHRIVLFVPTIWRPDHRIVLFVPTVNPAAHLPRACPVWQAHATCAGDREHVEASPSLERSWSSGDQMFATCSATRSMSAGSSIGRFGLFTFTPAARVPSWVPTLSSVNLRPLAVDTTTTR